MCKDRDFPDYQAMIHSGKCKKSEIGLLYILDYYGYDLRDELQLFRCISTYLDDANELLKIFGIITSPNYCDNKRMFLTNDVQNLSYLTINILMKNKFYYELLAIVLGVAIKNKTDSYVKMMFDDFSGLFVMLSRQEAEIILELLNDNGMIKEAAMFLNIRQGFGNEVTDFDL